MKVKNIKKYKIATVIIAIILVVMIPMSILLTNVKAADTDAETGNIPYGTNGNNTNFFIPDREGINDSEGSRPYGYRFSLYNSDGKKMGKTLDLFDNLDKNLYCFTKQYTKLQIKNLFDEISNNSSYSTAMYDKLEANAGKRKIQDAIEQKEYCNWSSICAEYGFPSYIKTPSGTNSASIIGYSTDDNKNGLVSKTQCMSYITAKITADIPDDANWDWAKTYKQGYYLAVEPMYQVTLRGYTYYATPTEIALYGIVDTHSLKVVSDSKDVFGYISAATNAGFPIALYENDGRNILNDGASNTNSNGIIKKGNLLSFRQIILQGYGIGFIYQELYPYRLTVRYKVSSNKSASVSSPYSVKSSTDSVKNNRIFKDGDYCTQVFITNVPQDNGLVNASTFGLKYKNYTHNGKWKLITSGFEKTGDSIDENTKKLYIKNLLGEKLSENTTVTVESQVDENSLEVLFNANGGSISTNATYRVGSDKKIEKKNASGTYFDVYRDYINHIL